jgi:hypothetical protein
MKMTINNLLTFIIIILIAGCAYLAGSCSKQPEHFEPIKTDTVFINRSYTDTVVIHHFAKPKTVTVYKERNKERREAMEQRTIIQGLRIQPKGVEVATIDTAGFTRVAFYPTPVSAEISIADTGAVQITPIKSQKANFRKAGNLVLILAAFGLGVLL